MSVGALAKLQEVTVSFIMSVCPHGTTRLPLDEFLRNLIMGDLLKIIKKI